MKFLLTQIIFALILSKAFVILYRYLCMRCVNALKINMNYNYCFNNVKFKCYLYCVNKKESCVLIRIPNFFSALQLIRYLLDLDLILIIIITFKLHYIKI